MKALSEKGQSDFPCGRTIAQLCELRAQCFASTSLSNTVTQGWSWQPPLPTSHHAPHSTTGRGPMHLCTAPDTLPFSPWLVWKGERRTLHHLWGARGGHCFSPTVSPPRACCNCLNMCGWQEGSAWARALPAGTTASQVPRSRRAALLVCSIFYCLGRCLSTDSGGVGCQGIRTLFFYNCCRTKNMLAWISCCSKTNMLTVTHAN